MPFRLAPILLALAAAPLGADDAAPGHSQHGEAFDAGPRQKAALLGGTGKVRLPVTARHPEAQAFFDQGVGQLHGFWYFEAERSFRHVALLDPDCAMAYWGMAAANWNNRKRAEGFIQVAASKKAKASPREQRWVAAYADFWQTKKPEKDARRDLVKALEDLAFDFPDELEAKAFVLFHVWDNSEKGWPIGSKLTVDALARQVFATEPMHPAHHYVIHLWDADKPARALASAAKCGPAAPGVAHMWHMPGHTYSKLKRFADAAWQQEAAARTDHRHMLRDRLLPDQIHNYAHNGQWLAQNLTFLGRAREAVAVSRNLIELPRHPKYNTLDGRKAGSSADGRKRLLETLTRYEMWGDLIALAEGPSLEPTDLPAEQVKRLRALGVAHFASGNADGGREQIAALDALLAQSKAARASLAVVGGTAARSGRTEPTGPAENAIAELRIWDALARGDQSAARTALAATKDVSPDRLARLWLAAGDKEKALKAARDAAASGVGQVDRHALLVELLEACGKRSEAAEQFRKLREVAGHADRDLPIFRRLAPLAEQLKFPADWRAPKPPASDLGHRPELASLGPFFWEPWAAPAFHLTGADGRAVTLADYRGRPVVLLATLGFGCVHCVGQLKAFAAMKEQFAAAGIEILAVGTDEPDSLVESLGAGGAGAGLPFPVVADPELAFFRAYRAYDEFEDQPLHAAFLLDGAGRVRWHDIGAEPFTDAEFLLRESRRLLAFVGPAQK